MAPTTSAHHIPRSIDRHALSEAKAWAVGLTTKATLLITVEPVTHYELYKLAIV